LNDWDCTARVLFYSAFAMPSKNEILSNLTDPGVVAVIRIPQRGQVLPLARALLAGGLTAIEITMTTPDALGVIRELSGTLDARAVVGVGTVLDRATAERALEAGAQFVVSPILRAEIAQAAHAAEKPVMLGAFTPTEAQQAWEAGSDFIKIFPADTLGPPFVKAVLAPLPHLRIIPTGIAKPEDVSAFIQAGCAGVGLGSLLVPRDALRESNWERITRLAQQFVGMVAQARKKTPP
jgi:2-dehydro-3-deoxyphosphogluconate aldolase/(4S)-4-hydroxy-2-oxoglutarate aldolase